MNFNDIKTTAEFLVGELRDSFKNAARKNKTVRELTLKFHRATMTPAQNLAYQKISATKAAYDEKGPCFTVAEDINAMDAAKALTVLELEQPAAKSSLIVKWQCRDSMEGIRSQQKRWF